MIRVTATTDSIDGPWDDQDHPDADGWITDSGELHVTKGGGRPLSRQRVATYPAGYWAKVVRVDDQTPTPPSDDAPMGHHDEHINPPDGRA